MPVGSISQGADTRLRLAAPARWRLWREWTRAFTLGELIGFGGIPVLGGAAGLWLTQGVDPPLRTIVLYAIAVVGGLGEGAVLALFQLRVLRRYLQGIDTARWIGVTAAAAAFAWACGMLAPTLDELFGLSAAIQVAIWLPAGIAILLSIGSAQAWALRGLVRHPRRWVTANACGWLAGLPWTFVLPALLPETAAMPVWIATFVAAGVLMGLTAGAVTGAFLVRLLQAGPLREDRVAA